MTFESCFEAYLQQGRMPAALLVVGNDEAKQTAAANQLASRLLCERHTVCGACDACRLGEHHPDKQWLTPDNKTIQVDQIREMINTVMQTAHGSQGKIVLIQPADAMNIAAMNSLLKVMEEPPAGVLFVLLTADPDRLLPTIRSRCQLLPGFSQEAHVPWLSTHPQFFEEMQSFCEGRLSAVALAKQYAKEDMMSLLNVWQLMVFDFIRLNQGMASTLALPFGYTSYAASILNTKWYALLDKLQQAKRALLVNVNAELLLDDLLITWSSLSLNKELAC